MGLGMGSLARALALWWPAWGKRTHNDRPRKELVDHTLADAALSRADVTSAGAQVRSDTLRMMRYFKVDPDRIPGPFWGAVHEAERVCTQRVAVGRCRRWFQRQPTDDAPRRFCPNAQLYEDIAISQRRAHQPSDSPNN